MKYPPDFIERVRESSNLVDIIGQYVQLRRAGVNYQGLCPFHNEKSPSFSVSETKQVYHCFGCKASGDVFQFVTAYQGLTFPEAIEYLARRASLPLPEVKGEMGSGAKDQKATLYRINALAAQFFQAELAKLPESHPMKEYLRKRELTADMVQAYKLGYAPNSWSELTEFFASKRVPIAAAEQLHLIKPRSGGKNGHFDMFRHRFMFPIFSPTGQCLGFGGRVLSSEQQPKYLNSQDSIIFNKSKVLYGLDHSAKHIRQDDEAIVVEGYMDWLALVKHNIHNVVATLGTALTADHARMIKRYTNRVLVLFDGDSAGREAARRSLGILLAEGVHARGLFLPDKLDPDEFLKMRGEMALRQHIQSAPDLFELVANDSWTKGKSSPTYKIQLLDELAEELALVQDDRLKRLYASNLANMLDVDIKLVERSVANVGKQPRPGQPKPVGASAPTGPAKSPVSAESGSVGTKTLEPRASKIDLKRVPRAEADLLNLILMKEVYLKEALALEVADKFSHPGARAVFLRVEERYRHSPSSFDSLSVLLANEVEPAEVITRHLSEALSELNDESLRKMLQDCVKRVKETALRVKSKELLSSLRGSLNRDS